MKLTAAVTPSASAGLYNAEFKGCTETSHPEYGAGIDWIWEIVDGPSRGEVVTRRSGLRPSSRNTCGRIVAGILGRELQPGEEIDLQELVGTVCKVFVGQADSGWPRVESVIRA